MKFKFSTFILLFAILAPFDLLLLKFLPLGEKAYGYGRFFVEFAMYLLFFMLILRNLVHGKLFTRTVIDVPLLFFLIVSVFSIVINRVPIGPAMMGWRDLWRWVLLFYILANLNLDDKFHRRIILMFVVIGCVQGLIATTQHFVGVSDIFKPRASTVEIGGKITNYKVLATDNNGFEKGSGVGTITDAVQLATYLLICLSVLIPLFLQYVRTGMVKRFGNYIIFIAIMLGIFMSYSRVSVLFALLAIFITYLVAKELRRLFPIAIVASLVIVVSLAFIATVPSNKSSTYYNPRLKETSPIDNFTQLFSSELAEKSIQNSRGFVVENALPALIKSLNLIGYGPDVDNSLLKLVQRDLDNATPFANYRIINDVYWIGMITCYGLIGVSIFIYILYRLFKMTMYVYKNTESPYMKILSLAFLTILIISIPYTAVIRTFVFRMFALYFWLIAGIVASEFRKLKEQTMIEAEEEEIREQYNLTKSESLISA
nr:O-antigen ligase family protein [Bacteroidota bacterium]